MAGEENNSEEEQQQDPNSNEETSSDNGSEPDEIKSNLPIQDTEEPTKIIKTHPDEIITQSVIEDEMKKSYLEYAMSVIVGRALPDVRDGLKPVHRRILYAMNELGILHNKPFRKSARIVGEVLGKYHPHGDTAVYDSMVRMAQDFSLRYMLVNGQGNFGSIDGDSPAAMRYTEARLSKIAEEMLTDIKKETIDYQPNFDDSLKEPAVLPSAIPNLLVNGSSGIAVGMATNIPPHNLREVIDGVIKVIDNPDVEINEIIESIKGPDFPTGASICGKGGIISAYTYGKGKIIVKAKADIEDSKSGQRIIISEIPYMVNKAILIEEIARQVRNKVILGIRDLRDESDREGMRIVIELKKDATSEIVLNQLYKHSKLQTTFGVGMLALVNNEPKVLNIKQMISYYVNHRFEIVQRRTEFDLRKAQERCHILEGLITALDHIDEVIPKIKASRTVDVAREVLMKDYSLSDKQANAILEMRLQKLASLEQEKLRKEHNEILELIEQLKAILADDQKIYSIIKEELLKIKDEYGDDRKTEILQGDDTVIMDEDLIEDERVVVTVTHSGYVKRLPADTYKQQQRGGKGVIAATTHEGDYVEHLFVASTHSYMLVFTEKGQVHWLKVYHVPEGSRQARGKAIVNIVNIGNDDKVATIIPVKQLGDDYYLILATKKGIVKKTHLSEYSKPRQGGIRAITLDEGDILIKALLTDGNKQVMLATSSGLVVRFNEKDARSIGRTSKGVKGINLRNNDEVIGMVVASDSRNLLTITENGYGKQTPTVQYRVINRGGVGVINIKTSERNGKVVSVMPVTDKNDIMFISQKGIVIRVPVKGISTIGRNTQGVRLMRLTDGDKVVATAKIITEEPKLEEATEEDEERDDAPALKAEEEKAPAQSKTEATENESPSNNP